MRLIDSHSFQVSSREKMLNFQPFFQTISLAWGRNPVVTIFLIFLALQLSYRPEYVFAPDYLTRTSPTYDPNPSNESTGFIGALFGAVTKLLKVNEVPDNACVRSNRGEQLVFDFIVVGAGASGSAIAAGLSENNSWNILLVEAGGDPVVESVPPVLYSYGVKNSRVWRYHAEPVNSSSQAFVNGRPMPHGKQLGGSTGDNSYAWVCGQDRDYDSWAAQGNDGWNYTTILPLINRTENNQDSSVNPAYHGFNGSVYVSTYPLIDPFVNTIRNGLNQLKYKTLTDLNNDQGYNGFVPLQATVKNGERNSAYQAFIQPIKERPNLFIAKNTLVTKILFNENKAIGVNVKTTLSDCPSIDFYASKETIISAGALGSPKILLQSGIGPNSDLMALNISVVKDLPGVGSNLQDHPIVIHYVKMKTGEPDKSYFRLGLDGIEYYLKRSGYFAEFATFYAQGFINVSDVNSKYSDIQLILNRFPKQFPDFSPGLANFGYKDSFNYQLTEINKGHELIEFFTTVLNPKARGKVSLRGKEPELLPKIVSNFFTNEDDIAAVIRGFNKTRELLQTPAFKNISAEFHKFDIPQCNSINYPSDEYERCYLKYFSGSLWNPVGTCKMGPTSDQQAVVDNELNVHGIVNLRIADASILPTIPSGHLACPCYVVGQKAVDLIKKTWSSKS